MRHELHPARRRPQAGQQRQHCLDRGCQSRARDRPPPAGCGPGSRRRARDGEAMAPAREVSTSSSWPSGVGVRSHEPQRRPRSRHSRGSAGRDRRRGRRDPRTRARPRSGLPWRLRGSNSREQPALGRIVGAGAAVIVEMVAADVGERGRGQPQAVDAMLVEPVARGLDRQMVDAAAPRVRPPCGAA